MTSNLTRVLALLGAASTLATIGSAHPQRTRTTYLERASDEDLFALEEVAVHATPRPDVEALRIEDERRLAGELPPRYAVPEHVSITPFTHGTWENLADGRLLWRLRIEAQGARSINLGFGRYAMPEGGALHLYSSDLSRFVRPFTAADNEAHGELWTPLVPTEELVVELVLPAKRVGEVELELTQVGYGYRGFSAVEEVNSRSGSCNVDVVCPQGDDWRAEIPSVGVISLGGGTFCTGFMVNNVRGDGRPFFMTADHCGVRAGNASSLVVFWNYENSFCRTPGSPQSGGAGNGSLSQFNTGSIFRSAYSASDFTLVELDDLPDPEYSVTYSGWDATGTDANMAIAIHHPNTDEKRISFENQPTTTTSYLSNAVPGNGTHVRVEDWDLGTTEPGSSGSPLYDQNHRVIGQLHGGFASCSSQTSDWYGKFSVSWNGGGTSSSRLRDWLDPDGTGTLLVDTMGGTVRGSVTVFGVEPSGSNVGRILSSSTPTIGASFSIDISRFDNTNLVSLIVSTGQTSTPLFGGTVYVDLGQVIASVSVALSGGAGSLAPTLPTDPSLVGTTVYAQAGGADATQPSGVALSNGMAILIGEPAS